MYTWFVLLNLDTIRIVIHVILKFRYIGNNLILSMIHNLEELKQFHYKQPQREQLHLVEGNKYIRRFDRDRFHYNKLHYCNSLLQEELELELVCFQELELECILVLVLGFFFCSIGQHVVALNCFGSELTHSHFPIRSLHFPRAQHPFNSGGHSTRFSLAGAVG